MRKAIENYNMINEGDKIAVGLSGGKDSITLLMGLKALQRFYPKKFEVVAISVNPGFEFFDTTLLQEMCDKLEIPFYVLNFKKEFKEKFFLFLKQSKP